MALNSLPFRRMEAWRASVGLLAEEADARARLHPLVRLSFEMLAKDYRAKAETVPPTAANSELRQQS